MAGSVESTVDVLVVGAGIAGLHCAQLLHEAGRKVVIVEAASYIGCAHSAVHD